MTAPDFTDPADRELLFKRLAAPTPSEKVQWRRGDGPMKQINGQPHARWFAYVDARFVQQRLDEVACGQWQLELEPWPDVADRHGVTEPSIKASLTVFGDTRESIGTDSNDKAADSDAFKRAGVRFGIAADLYEYEENWVPMAGSEPAVDAAENYQRILAGLTESGRSGQAAPVNRGAAGEPSPGPGSSARARAPMPVKRRGKTAPMACPVCKGEMWDNVDSRYEGQPDYVCKNRALCPGKYKLTDEERAVLLAEDPEKARAEIAAGKPAVLVDQKDGLPF